MKHLYFFRLLFLLCSISQAQTWSKIENHSDVLEGSTYLIVDVNKRVALTSANGMGSAPATRSVQITNESIISGEIALDLQWVFVKSGNFYTIHPKENRGVWLYSTATNNGVRVGTNSNKLWSLGFELSAYKGMVNESLTEKRYLGVYLNQDWRAYTHSSVNIGSTQIELFKLVEAVNPPILVNESYKATVGESFMQTIHNSGGNSLFSLVSGSLPDGITLNSTGSFAGVPLQSGRYEMVIKAVNGQGSSQAVYVITIDKGNQQLSLPTIEGQINEQVMLPRITSVGGQEVTYQVINPTIARVIDNELRFLQEGMTPVRASALANDHYTAFETTFDVTVKDPSNGFELVTSVDELDEGDEVIFVGRKSNQLYAMDEQRAQNRGSSAIVGTYFSVPSFIETRFLNAFKKLKIKKDGPLFSFFDEEFPGFLYVTSTSSNTLLTQLSLTNQAKWSISTLPNGESTLTNSVNNRLLRFNLNNQNPPLFSTYVKDQQPIFIYKKNAPLQPQEVEEPFEDVVYELGQTPVALDQTHTLQNSPLTYLSSNSTVVNVVAGNQLSFQGIGTADIQVIAPSLPGYQAFYTTFSVEVIASTLGKVKAKKATHIYHDEFTMNWEQLSNATNYLVSVYQKKPTSFSNNLIISEYGEGKGGSKKYIELANYTGKAVNLDDYRIVRASNGGTWTDGGNLRVNFEARVLPHGQVIVIAHNAMDVDVSDVEYTLISSFINMNGNDAIGLQWNGGQGDYFHLIDAIGEHNNNPGIAWDVAGVNQATKDRILIRKPSVYQGNTNWDMARGTTVENSEWMVSDFEYNHPSQTTNLGVHHFGGVGFVHEYVLKQYNVGVLNHYRLTNNQRDIQTLLVDDTPYYYGIYAVKDTQISPVSNEVEMKTNKLTVWDNDRWSKGAPVDYLTDAVVKANYPNDVADEGSLMAHALKVGPDAQVTVGENHFWMIKNELEVDSSSRVKFKEKAYLLQENPEIVNRSNVAFERQAEFYKYDTKMWSSPVIAQKIKKANQHDTSGFVFKPSGVFVFDDLTTKWIQTKDTQFMPGVGYGIQMNLGYNAYPNGGPSQLFEGVFQGVPVNGTVRVPVTHQLNGYNAIGNPYGSPIRLDALIEHNYLTNAQGIEIESIHFWNEKAHYAIPGGYQGQFWDVYNGTGNTANSSDDVWVGVGVGFVVKTTNAGDLELTNAMRDIPSAQQTILHKKPEEKSRYWLTLFADSLPQNNLLIGYLKGATDGHDAWFDAESIQMNGSHLLSREGPYRYRIQGRSWPMDKQDRVSLSFTAEKAGEFRIELMSMDGVFIDRQPIYLIDHHAQKHIHLTKDNAYVFTSEKGQFDHRFEVTYDVDKLSNAVERSSDDVQAIVVGEHIHVKSKNNILSYQLFDLSGRLIQSKNQTINSNFTIPVQGKKGVVILQIQTQQGKNLTFKLRIR